MADRLVRLKDKDDYNIYPVTMLQDDYILWDETEEDNQIINDMVGATSSADGEHGLVPQPVAGDQDKVLHGNAKWKYPPGTILTFTEWLSSDYALTYTNQAITAFTGTGYNQYGPLAGSNQNTTIVVPSGQTWTILVECHAHMNIKSYDDNAWMGPAVIYTKDGGSEQKWASSICTNRGVTSADNWFTCDVARVGALAAGTWIFKPAYVTGNLSTSGVFHFRGQVGADYSRGAAYTMKVTLISIRET